MRALSDSLRFGIVGMNRFRARFHAPSRSVLALGVAVLAAGISVTLSCGPAGADMDAFAYNRLLGRGMNLGNALDAPREGAWGVTLKQKYFQAVKDAGFDSVRIPVRWSAHAASEPPYTIDSAFFRRVDWAIDQALSRNLSVVIDVHHYNEMDQHPAENAPRLIALWKQIAAHYRYRSQRLFFELFNEPHDNFTDDLWNGIIPDLLRAVRQTNPRRLVIVGPASWNAAGYLPLLRLPQDDRRLIVTFHYYNPLHFTHQGETWLPNSEAWQGTLWGTAQERDSLREDFEKAAAWGRQHDRPLYLGEFGATRNADMNARILWTQAVVSAAERAGFSWSYWLLYQSFGIYDPATGRWDQRLLRTLTARR